MYYTAGVPAARGKRRHLLFTRNRLVQESRPHRLVVVLDFENECSLVELCEMLFGLIERRAKLTPLLRLRPRREPLTAPAISL